MGRRLRANPKLQHLVRWRLCAPCSCWFAAAESDLPNASGDKVTPFEAKSKDAVWLAALCSRDPDSIAERHRLSAPGHSVRCGFKLLLWWLTYAQARSCWTMTFWLALRVCRRSPCIPS
jgi:hypothetical protein